MGRQIIKQPNGKYCVFSSVVDNVIFCHMEEKDIVDELVNEYRKEMEEKVKKIIFDLENDKKPYYQFTMSYPQLLQKIKEIHGKQEADEIKRIIEETPDNEAQTC